MLLAIAPYPLNARSGTTCPVAVKPVSLGHMNSFRGVEISFCKLVMLLASRESGFCPASTMSSRYGPTARSRWRFR